MNNNGGRGKVHILRKIFIITFLLSNFVFSQSHIEQWLVTPLPIRTRIVHIQSFNHNGCIAAAGKYLIQFKNGAWKIFSKQPPVKNIDRLFVSSDDNIWVSEGTFSYESNLYIFRDNKWEKIDSPFLNQVKSADFLTNGQAYFSGDRELYLLNKGQWHNFKYPPISVAIMTIKSNGKSLLALTSSRNIYLYKSSKWSLELKDKIILQIERRGKDYIAITNSEIFKFDGTHGWQMMLNTGNKFELKKAVVLSNDNVYAISANNKLFHYAKNTWQNIELKNSDELDDIVTINDSIVIVAGNNGLTWYNGNVKSQNSDQYLSGFTSVLPVALSKEVNDEYGVCINDVNNDGLMDIYSVRIFEPNRLYVNKDKGAQRYPDFSDEAVERDVTGINGNNKQNIKDLFLGCGIADLDNDGDKDIYLCNLTGENKLFINKGNGYFRSVSNEDDRGLGKNDRSNSVIFGDVDNDGDLDIFVTNEYSSNRLFINNGFGYFLDVTEKSGLKSDWGGMSAAFADIDNDNDPDLCVTNWGKPNKIYRNVSGNKQIKFQDISATCGIEQSSFTKSNGCVFADIDNDGDLDLFIANRKTTNELYRNNGEGKFESITLPAIGRDSDLSYGAVFGDFDQDGYQDLFVTNIGDHKLYKNINGKVFKDVSLSTGIILSGYGTGTSTGDLDNDGDLDIYSAEYINASSTIFYNETNNERFIKCKLTGTISNRDAVGAKLWLYEKNNHKLVGYREVSSGSGYSSGNPQVVHFGLPSANKYELEIYFPASGIKKIIRNIEPGASLNISEETGIDAYRTLISKKINIVIADREVLEEELKFLFLSLIILTSFLLTRKKLKWRLKINLAIHLVAFVVYFILLSQFIYDGFFLSSVIPVASSISFLAVVHLVYQKVILGKRISEENKITRDKIARDLHDDLASTISSAAIYTDYLRRHSKNGKTMKNLVDKIHNLMLDSLNSVNDIIWIAVTKNDTVGDLRDKINSLLQDVSDSNLIRIDTQIEIEKPELTIKEDYKRNVFLIVKEALNNSLKYSECDEITFIFKQTGNQVHLELIDNGKGFNIDSFNGKIVGNGGRGLPNMQARAAIIDAVFNIDSSPDKGTQIKVDFKMT